MPFSSLSDPFELSRAATAVEAAWREIRRENPDENERGRLNVAYIIAGLVPTVKDSQELLRRALARYREMQRSDLAERNPLWQAPGHYSRSA